MFNVTLTRTADGVDWTVTDSEGTVKGRGWAYTYGIAQLRADGRISELEAREARKA